MLPNGDFPTVRVPNPEDPAAFELALKMQEALGADLCVGTDPDCDRVGIACMTENGPRLLNGNQIGCVLLHYILSQKKERGEQTALERVLDVPLSLPALMRGQKIVRREAGAKGQTLDGAAMLARVAELAGQTGGDRAAQEARLGEMLECLCAAAEAQGLDAETALRGQTRKRVERLRAEDEKTL